MLIVGSIFGGGVSSLEVKDFYNEFEKPLKFIDVTPEEANEMMIADKIIVIVDVRINEEYDSGHIAEAISIPFLACSECFLLKLSEYQDKAILVYGDDDELSRLACSYLIENSFSNVYRLLGGVAAWLSSGFSLVESSSESNGSSNGLSSEDIATLQKIGEEEGWTFTVGENPATEYSLDELCGFRVPDDWWVDATFDPCTPRGSLPDSFDWRDEGGCTPVKDQGNCGSCWAFATVGPLESNILIKDGAEEDLSEQWLVSCNRDGYGCNGGWWAHDYHQWKTDSCGGTGAVMEDDFPYVGYDAPCDCPYPHEYLIDDWVFIGSQHGIPPVNSIKQAIMDYGPVSVAVRANSAMQTYTGGIFNGCEGGDVNHAVVLVGWDDNQGSDGVWFMRNSWGQDWGEDGGYMRIPYGCSSIGYSANYIDYVSSAGDKQVDIKIHRITNDPDEGDFDEIDEWWDLRGGIKPEWYYRVGVEADGDNKYQHNYNRDYDGWWVFQWISEHTWNAQQVHIFHVDDTTIDFTIKLMDDDVISGDDLADVSAYPGGGADDDVSDKRTAIYHGTYNLATDELTGDSTSDDGGYKVTLGDGINNAKVWFKITDDYEPEPDLDCEGSLSWSDVGPGKTVTGSFKVKNIGDADSELDWEVKTWPSWGTWTFTPSNGNNLKPEDGAKTVQVSVKAPNQQNQEFTGDVKVVNKENSGDYEIIPVSLTTPKNQQSSQPYVSNGFLQLLQRLMQNLH
jgi:C1A family cysteine protease/rhodanese-related sulfurtransferase